MIRNYTQSDKGKLIELLQLNTPDYFDPSEEIEFSDYLDTDSEHYFVFEENDNILGCGGINYGFDQGKSVRISWDMIHPSAQGRGIGSQLVQFRIEQIRKDSQVEKIIVRTSQLVYLFYAKQGFVLDKVEKDYWSPGYDLYEMSQTI